LPGIKALVSADIPVELAAMMIDRMPAPRDMRIADFF
jgi:hypothetical protein